MAQKIPKKIRQNIDAYVSVIEKDIPISGVYIFGSHAKGTARSDSDIDIAIISSAFDKGTQYNGQWLVQKIWDVPFKNIDVVGYSPQYFRRLSSPILAEIRKTGVLLS